MKKKSNLQEIFAKNMKERRKYFKLTQLQLAEKIEVSTSFITEIETGRKSPSFSTIEKLSEALQLPSWAFFCNFGGKIPANIEGKEHLALILKTEISKKIDEIVSEN